MPANWNPQANAIFLQALEQLPAEREGFLQQACGSDSALAEQVRSLMAASEHAGSFLEHPAVELATKVFTDDTDEVHETDQQPQTVTTASICLDFLEPSHEPGSLGRLGIYEILEPVGRGGMGLVLKARDTKLHRIVAVKVLAPELASNPTARKRFLREAQAAAAISHDHIVSIYAVEESEEAPSQTPPFLVMEFIEGESLQQKLDREGSLEPIEILRIGRQIAAGLAAAHQLGLVHRDIKPANILLQNGVQRVKVTDFGLARAADDVAITQTGEVTGTPQYMSPEQAQGHAVDARSDLFSLGSVMYAMCTGRSPFRAESTVASLRRVCDDTPRPIRETNPEIPLWLVEITDHLLEKKPEDRPQSAEEISELFAKCLARLQEVGPTSMAGIVLPQRQRLATRPVAETSRRLPTWQIAALVLLAFGLLLGATEATGVTALSGTVIRIVTGEGTLVIEVDDPTVQVSLDGEELKITGAGLQELKLRPGQYQFQATKDGKPIEQKLVTITRGDREVLRVTRAPSGPHPLIAAPGEKGAFVVLGEAAKEISKFDTLADAVVGSSAGDTIEIRGNGPFFTDPVQISHPLAIRAAQGFEPVIRSQPRAALSRSNPLIDQRAVLLLEGIHIEVLSSADGRELERQYGNEYHLHLDCAITSGAHLKMANCRIVLPKNGFGVWSASECDFQNCQLMARADAVTLVEANGVNQKARIRNCLINSIGVGSVGHRPIEMQLESNTVCNDRWLLKLWPDEKERDVAENAAFNPLRIRGGNNIYVLGDALLDIQVHENLKESFAIDSAIAWLRGAVDRQEAGSLLAGQHPVVRVARPQANHQGSEYSEVISQLSDWNAIWNDDRDSSAISVVRLKGGDLKGLIARDMARLTPEDFRLRPDSAGYHAGPEGKGLGADIDRVGPGEAYERWKLTPEYEQWRQQTQELMRTATTDTPDAAKATSAADAAGVEENDNPPPSENPTEPQPAATDS